MGSIGMEVGVGGIAVGAGAAGSGQDEVGVGVRVKEAGFGITLIVGSRLLRSISSLRMPLMSPRWLRGDSFNGGIVGEEELVKTGRRVQWGAMFTTSVTSAIMLVRRLLMSDLSSCLE